MINTMLVYDNADTSLGDFFQLCSNRTKEFLSENDDILVEEIKSNILNDLTINLRSKQVNKKPFIFISYSHGSETDLLKSGVTPYISTTINCDSLINAFAYCFSCESGKELGKALCDKGTLCFIGYNKIVTVQLYFDYVDSFKECAVKGIESFVNGNTTGEVLVDMKNIYTNSIDELYLKDFPTASLLMDNRDALVIHGDTKLTLNDFKI